MAREPWKCPHADCKRECSRGWNMERHIKRKHKGEGVPVKNQSSVPYPRSQTAKEENIKTGQKVKTTGELDPIDVIYPIFKKYKDRNDKIEEMDNYFAFLTKIQEYRFLPIFIQLYSITTPIQRLIHLLVFGRIYA